MFIIHLISKQFFPFAYQNNLCCLKLLQELENNHLDTGRNMLKTMQLKPQVRQQLTLLLQRQNIEEQELRLRHWMELEKFYKGLGEC